MNKLSLAVAITCYALEGVLLLRGKAQQLLSRFLLFYSYVAYILFSSALILPIHLFWPRYYPNAFWFVFLIALLAEFAVLMEISDDIFAPYPALRRLGRFLTLTVGGLFSVLYVLPSVLQSQSSAAAMMHLFKRSSLTKGVVIVILLAAARRYRLPLGRNVSGVLIGFATYFGINIANSTLAQSYGPAHYALVLSLVSPLSYLLMLAVWTISLWYSQPAVARTREPRLNRHEVPASLGSQLGRFNAVLARLLRR